MFGRFNVMITTAIVTALLVLALWLPSAGPAPIFLFAVLFGFSSGTYVAMTPAIIAQISDIRAIGVRNGTNFFFVSFAALIGNPIAGALIGRDNGGYKYMQISAAVRCFLAVHSLLQPGRCRLASSGQRSRGKVRP